MPLWTASRNSATTFERSSPGRDAALRRPAQRPCSSANTRTAQRAVPTNSDLRTGGVSSTLPALMESGRSNLAVCLVEKVTPQQNVEIAHHRRETQRGRGPRPRLGQGAEKRRRLRERPIRHFFRRRSRRGIVHAGGHRQEKIWFLAPG